MTLPPKVLAWWRLLRIANVFTAVSNVVAGYLLAGGSLDKPFGLIAACAASALIYAGGMVLNDVLDYELDCVERPERPLPSGAISLGVARVVAGVLLLGGVGLASIAGVQSAATATALVFCVVLYDAKLKSTPAGPLGMGGCRLLNALLGASVAGLWQAGPLVYSGLLGAYTAGLTWFARSENEAGWGSDQATGQGVLALALGSLPALPFLVLGANSIAVPHFFWMLGWAGLTAGFGKLLLRVRSDPTPEAIRRFVGWMILGFLAVDALVCLAAGGWVAGAAVLFLVLPTLLLARVAPMT